MQKTISSIFLVPTLKIGRTALNDNGFINGYIHDSTSDIVYEESIYLLFKPEHPVRFRDFLNREHKRTNSIIDQYDKKLGLCVLVYKLNHEFKPDIELVKSSKYSKTSLEFQNMFPKTVDIKKDGRSIKEISLQYRIFNKTPDLLQYWKENNIGYNYEKEIWHDFEYQKEIINEDVLNAAALSNC